MADVTTIVDVRLGKTSMKAGPEAKGTGGSGRSARVS